MTKNDRYTKIKPACKLKSVELFKPSNKKTWSMNSTKKILGGK
jgi:hypothetical protein